jgi:hypothetical protein
MNSIEVTTKVVKITDEVVKSDKFRFRELWFDTKDQYPQKITVQFVNDKADLLADIKAGDEVSLKFDIRGNEWQNKRFVSLNGWWVQKVQSEPNSPEPEDDMPF